MDGDGALPPLFPLRQQILEGDYRVLYLAWLKANRFVDDDEEDRVEPPVPPGLRALSPPLEAFVEFFGIDADLLAVAANASSAAAPDADLEPSVSALTEAERCEFLQSLLRGDPGVATQLRLRLKEIASQQQSSVKTTEPSSRRLLSDLLQSAEAISTGRAQQEKQAQEAARLRKLEGLAEKETRLWAQASGLVAQKNVKAYDEAVGIFKDLQELAKNRNQLSSFTARVEQLQKQYPGLSGLRSRLGAAGLLPRQL